MNNSADIADNKVADTADDGFTDNDNPPPAEVRSVLAEQQLSRELPVRPLVSNFSPVLWTFFSQALS